MKTRLLSLLLILISGTAMANDYKYNEMMTKNIDLVYSAKTVEELQQAVNTFDRIGNAEKSRWEPFYFASFGNVLLATKESDPARKDAFLDLAKAVLDKAGAIKGDDSEIVALEGFILMIRVTVDPATRGQKYSFMAMQAFEKAIVLNPENPRAHALKAQMELGTARFFKVAPIDACATARKALEKFASYQPVSPFGPMWGKGMTEEMLKNCN